MTSSSKQNPKTAVDSCIDRMMTILGSSHLTQKKVSRENSKIFGVSLPELLARETDQGTNVPYVVRRICEYIENNGIQHEGLFRLSGNIKTIEKLKMSFDHMGDVDLEETRDMVAVAGLLKLFLRELPEAIIPSNLHKQFVCAQTENVHDQDECIRQLKQLVEQLPDESFATLRYLMSFLARVSMQEVCNRMGPTTLGIVFGPNLFRVSEDIEGLREQAVTNQIVTRFIVNFSAIFEADSISQETESSRTYSRHSKTNKGPIIICPADGCEVDSSPLSSASDKELSVTDIDDSSDQLSGTTSLDRFVEMAISQCVTERLFGNSGTAHDVHAIADVNGKNSKIKKSYAADGTTDGSTSMASTRLLDESVANEKSNSNCHVHKAAPNNVSQQYHHYHQHADHCMSVGPQETGHEKAEPAPSVTLDLRRREWSFAYDDEYHEVKRSMERSQLFQRASIPKARRGRKNFRKSHSLGEIKHDLDCTDEDSLKENEEQEYCSSHEHHKQRSINNHRLNGAGGTSKMLLARHHASYDRQDQGRISHSLDLDSPPSPASADQLSHPFLELHPQHLEMESQSHLQNVESPSLSSSSSSSNGSILDPQTPSPSTTRKPYIPDLDLSILHEHGDGSEPIPTNQMRASWPITCMSRDDGDVILSPRTSHPKKKCAIAMDPNIPPSPPVEQEAFMKMTIKENEASSGSVKQLNKRIFTLKRKIKQFEETYEVEFGYRPSHADKMARGYIKKYMGELCKARKELKQLKENLLHSEVILAAREDLSNTFECPSTSKHNSEKDNHDDAASEEWLCMEESLAHMIQQLKDKRNVANRPEDLGEMDKDQVRDEKIAIQKSLLHYESIFGRPTSKPEKELMRPIYDRYRNVKRMLTKFVGSPKSKDQGAELQPILEHEAMDFTQASPQHRSSLTGDESIEHDNSRELQIISERYEEAICNVPGPDSKKAKKSHHASWPVTGNDSCTGYNNVESRSCNLHELALPELVQQQKRVKDEKKRLRRVLREFEEEFQRQTGRRVQREDRTPLQSMYAEYKQVKAKLRLLEALLSKHDHHYTI